MCEKKSDQGQKRRNIGRGFGTWVLVNFNDKSRSYSYIPNFRLKTPKLNTLSYQFTSFFSHSGVFHPSRSSGGGIVGWWANAIRSYFCSYNQLQPGLCSFKASLIPTERMEVPNQPSGVGGASCGGFNIPRPQN